MRAELHGVIAVELGPPHRGGARAEAREPHAQDQRARAAWVENTLTVGGVMVVGEVHAANSGDPYSLGPTTAYQGGPAEGKATAYTQTRQGRKVLATLTYDVSA